jgi:hypothetical protein
MVVGDSSNVLPGVIGPSEQDASGFEATAIYSADLYTMVLVTHTCTGNINSANIARLKLIEYLECISYTTK